MVATQDVNNKAEEETSMAKFRSKIINLKSQIQEDIHELSSEDEQ